MNDYKFDEALKARLRKHESGFSDDMWDRISGKEKERKRGFILHRYVILVILLLISIGGVYYFLKDGQTGRRGISDSKNEQKGIPANHKANSIERDKIVSTPITNAMEYNSPELDHAPIAELNHSNKDSRQRNLKEKKTSKPGVPASPEIMNRDLENNNTQSGDIKNDTKEETVKKEAEGKKAVPAKSTDTPAPQTISGDEDKFSVELYASPQLPFDDISSGNQSYEHFLKNAGSMELSYLFGMRMKYHISKRIAAKIGVQYSHITGHSSFADTLVNQYTANNKYKSIAVPLLVSYKTPWFRLVDFSINAGIILNVSSRYEGIIPSVGGQPIDIESNGVYSSNASAGFYLGADISKRIRKRTDLFVEPWLIYRPENMVSHYYGFDQRIHSWGVSLGIRYRLFKNQIP